MKRSRSFSAYLGPVIVHPAMALPRDDSFDSRLVAALGAARCELARRVASGRDRRLRSGSDFETNVPPLGAATR